MLRGNRLAFDKLSNEQVLTSSQRLFVDEFMAAAKRLFKLMDVHADDCLNYRLYDFEVVELNNEVSVLVLVPPAESSCCVPGQKELLLQRPDLISISVQSFEMNHLRTYQSRIIEKYSRLSCILELETVFAAHSQREAFSQAEVQVARERVQKLQELSQNLNGVWKGVRWVMDVIGFARDRTPACCAVTMDGVTTIWRQCGGGSHSGRGGKQAMVCGGQATTKHLLELPSSSSASSTKENVSANCQENQQHQQQQLQPSQQKAPMKTSPGRGSWPGPTVSDHLFLGDQEQHHSRSEQQLINKGTMGGSQQYLGVGGIRMGKTGGSSAGGGSRKNSADSNASQHSEPTSSGLSSGKLGPYLSGGGSSSSRSGGSVELLPRMQSSKSEDTLNVCSGEGKGGSSREQKKARAGEPLLEFSTIQVYAAYETGLTNGTSLKLHVTTETTSREVVDLVVKQLNMAVLLKGKEGPIYGERDLREFCLVAIIGARERCLRDDFRPLQLQNPWRKGRLYVRKKMDVLAALEHNNSQVKMI